MSHSASQSWRSVRLVAALACASWSTHALASENSAAALALFEQAKKLAGAGQYPAACAKFAESAQLEPSGGTLLHLASCHESEGKTTSAWSEFNEALSWARRDQRPDREAYAKAHIAALAKRLVTLTILVPDASRAASISITRDSRAISAAEWAVSVPVDPGEHVISASAPGKKPWTQTVIVDEQRGSVSVNVPLLQVDAEGRPTSAVSPSPGGGDASPDNATEHSNSAGPRLPDPARTQRTVGFALGAAGLVALGIGVVFDVSAHSKASDRDAAARNGDADATARLHGDAKSAERIAFITGGVGIAALGAGVALLLSTPKPKTGLWIAPRVAVNEVSIVIEGRQW